MRTCMYCGRELEKGESCDCPQSAARRSAKKETAPKDAPAADNQKKSYDDPYRTENSYKTGYVKNESWFERAGHKRRTKQEAKKRGSGARGFFGDLRGYIASSVKNPIDAVTNPKHTGKAVMLTIAAIAGALVWLCAFFIRRGGTIGPLRILSSVMSFGGSKGFRLIASLGLSVLSGALSGIIIFFIYTGIFYLINRYIMRQRTGYWSFCERLAAAWMPFTAVCLLGTILGMFSIITLITIVLCGAALVAVLTYEALKTEWYAMPPSKVLLGMMLGYFVFFSFIGHLMLIR